MNGVRGGTGEEVEGRIEGFLITNGFAEGIVDSICTAGVGLGNEVLNEVLCKWV